MKIFTGLFVILIFLFSCKNDSKIDVPLVEKSKTVKPNLHLKKIIDSLDTILPKVGYYLFDLNHDQLKELMVYDIDACKTPSKCEYYILQYDIEKDNYKTIGHLKGSFRDLISVEDGFDFINTGIPIDGSSSITSRYSYINGHYQLTKNTLVEIKKGEIIEINLLKSADSL
nr:hypothetical protein [uncultured Psychroserpens sp.]